MITIEEKLDDGTVKYTYESLEKPEQVQKLIEEFEFDHELRSKNLLGLDGLFENNHHSLKLFIFFLSRLSKYVIIQ